MLTSGRRRAALPSRCRACPRSDAAAMITTSPALVPMASTASTGKACANVGPPPPHTIIHPLVPPFAYVFASSLVLTRNVLWCQRLRSLLSVLRHVHLRRRVGPHLHRQVCAHVIRRGAVSVAHRAHVLRVSRRRRCRTVVPLWRSSIVFVRCAAVVRAWRALVFVLASLFLASCVVSCRNVSMCVCAFSGCDGACVNMMCGRQQHQPHRRQLRAGPRRAGRRGDARRVRGAPSHDLLLHVNLMHVCLMLVYRYLHIHHHVSSLPTAVVTSLPTAVVTDVRSVNANLWASFAGFSTDPSGLGFLASYATRRVYIHTSCVACVVCVVSVRSVALLCLLSVSL
jgi:hypothetical protein